MTLWLLVPLLLLVAVVQITLVPFWSVGGFKVDLPLMIVVAQGLVGSPGTSAQWGFIVGVFLDLGSGLPFGVHTLVLTTIGMLMDLGQVVFFRGNVAAPPVAMIVSTLVYDVLLLAILSLLNGSINWGDYLLRVTLPTAIFNTVAMPLVYFPLQWLRRRVRPQLEV